MRVRRAKSMVTGNDIREKIINIEWGMFSSVNEGEERASCQEDRVTFEGMRSAQFDAWSDDAAAAYLNDLETALACNRNLVEEKYIHMMKTTEPEQYEALLPRVSIPAPDTMDLAKKLSDLMLEQTRVLHEEYPFITGRGRPLYSEFDILTTSVETYQLCELMTYSGKTLDLLYSHALELEKAGVSISRRILENTVRFYGFGSLAQAEEITKTRADISGAPMVFGCAGGECDTDWTI